ncbi:hypothetical protein Pmani_008090 [Petrolisthes manimaculis]|uniref:Uncharacterized protein n=1 Tax=Petrolisthes manimaculis TaxID=1843537 RepID=A0AAE1Q9J3_9EUCA|nr:hypothetical protein Pmani_008090 [Petrolisthes manimaculis]
MPLWYRPSVPPTTMHPPAHLRSQLENTPGIQSCALVHSLHLGIETVLTHSLIAPLTHLLKTSSNTLKLLTPLGALLIHTHSTPPQLFSFPLTLTPCSHDPYL